MKQKYDELSFDCSKMTTRAYSTSFSLGIRFLQRHLHQSIYAIYGFVRFADEIVDSFHSYNKAVLLQEFKADTWKAIKDGISTNPILNSFQHTVARYGIENELIERFFNSMEADLEQKDHSESSYEQYIYGSAEVVGLMCLRVFTENDDILFRRLKQPARKGVYLAYFYYKKLFLMIKNLPAEKALSARIRIPNYKKIGLMFQSVIRHQLNLL